MTSAELPSGVIILDKPAGKTSFFLIKVLRRLTKQKKVGHAGTLDPFATGVMVCLLGKTYTRLSDQLLCQDKEYEATACLGKATDSFDLDGSVTDESPLVPTMAQVEATIAKFQGQIQQTPPMFSAKKINGQKLCDLARQGIVVERKACSCHVAISKVRYEYPLLHFTVSCSKGTYIRSLAHDIGLDLGCFAHLTGLRRTRSGVFTIDRALNLDQLNSLSPEQIQQHCVQDISHVSKVS